MVKFIFKFSHLQQNKCVCSTMFGKILNLSFRRTNYPTFSIFLFYYAGFPIRNVALAILIWREPNAF